MSIKKRKPKPSVPNWVYLDRDNCWCCKNRNGCGNCKLNKDFLKQKSKRKKTISFSE